MEKFIGIIAAVCLLSACQSPATNQIKTVQPGTDSAQNQLAVSDTGWVPLFDGKTLFGWHSYGQPVVDHEWSVDSGMIFMNAAESKKYPALGGGDLITAAEYSDFDLKLEWKISKGGNSGVLFYVHEEPTRYRETWNTGPEMQVLDNDGNPDGKIHKHRAGDLYDLIACSTESVKPVGQWNQVEIIANKGKLDFFLNGLHVVSTTLWDDHWKQLIAGSKFRDMPGFGTFRKGHIALQDHGFDVWFRNIIIKKL